MKIKQIKKIVITHLLALYSLMSMGCSQLGVNLIGENAPKKSPKKWINTRSVFKKPSAEKRIKTTNGKVIVKYKIDNNDQLQLHHLFEPTPDSGFDADLWAKERDNQAKHQRLFDLFAKLIPQKYRKGIQYFEIFDRKGTSTVAHIGPKNETTLKIFRLGIAFDLFEGEAWDYNETLGYPFIICTMLHEFGHYLTDNSKQAYRFMGIGRPFPKGNSIISKIRHTYFSAEEVYDYLITNPEVENLQSYEIMEEVVSKHKQEAIQKGRLLIDFDGKSYVKEAEFVTEYATESVYEDAAEAFVYFVLLDERPKPGDSPLKDKVLLFYENPKMVKARDDIRDRFKELGIHPKMSRDDLKKVIDALETPKLAPSKKENFVIKATEKLAWLSLQGGF